MSTTKNLNIVANFDSGTTNHKYRPYSNDVLHILSKVVITQKYLQQKDLDLIQCTSEIRNLDDFLHRQRESLAAGAVAKATDINYFVKRCELSLSGEFAEEEECLVKRLMMLVSH